MVVKRPSRVYVSLDGVGLGSVQNTGAQHNFAGVEQLRFTLSK